MRRRGSPAALKNRMATETKSTDRLNGPYPDAPLKASKTDKMSDLFGRAARTTSFLMGSGWSFSVATVVILVWAVSGPFFHFSDTWQLIINTGTTIVTFLMVFLIQNTQNRDARAVHLKLDEIICAIGSARNQLVDVEKCSDEELKQLQKEFECVREAAAQEAERRV
jgi:low affinity Fe/Cu permease